MVILKTHTLSLGIAVGMMISLQHNLHAMERLSKLVLFGASGAGALYVAHQNSGDIKADFSTNGMVNSLSIIALGMAGCLSCYNAVQQLSFQEQREQMKQGNTQNAIVLAVIGGFTIRFTLHHMENSFLKWLTLLAGAAAIYSGIEHLKR